jgi:hypothetical protein
MRSERISRLTLFFVMTSAAIPAAFADGVSVPPVRDAATAKECSACHMLYPSGLLPARSWTRMMSDLKNHFGDNADLDDKTRQAITDYLTANAGDKGWRPTKMVRGLAETDAPLRISELPYFRKEHRRIGPADLQRLGAKTIANCKACHPQAEQGQFDDD